MQADKKRTSVQLGVKLDEIDRIVFLHPVVHRCDIHNDVLRFQVGCIFFLALNAGRMARQAERLDLVENTRAGDVLPHGFSCRNVEILVVHASVEVTNTDAFEQVS